MSLDYLRENWLREPFQGIAEGEDAWSEALELQWDLMNPLDFHVFDFAREPNLDNFIMMMYKPGISYSGFRLALWATGEPYMGFWARQAWMMHARAQGARSVAGAVGGAVPYAVLAAATVGTATAAAVTYEMTVNRTIRESHPGSDGTWFGPYASGFGSVV